MHAYRVFSALLLSATTLPFHSHAAASLLVDDAGMTDPRHCQLESWARRTEAGHEWTVAPACTLAATEWSLGLTRLPDAAATQWAAGAKRVLRNMDQRRWGLAISTGVEGTTQRPRSDAWNVNLPLSVALDAQARVLLHLNLGWAHQDDARGRTSGVGVEMALRRPWSLLAETAHDAARQRRNQFGVRRALWHGASVDLLAGRTHGQPDARWLTLGFNLAALP